MPQISPLRAARIGACALLWLGVALAAPPEPPPRAAPSPSAPAPPTSDATSASAAPPAASVPAKFIFPTPTYRVLEDAVDPPIYVLPGRVPNGRVLVYLHGHCGDINAIGAFSEAATAHGTVITLLGDQPCKEKPGRFKWSRDIRGLDQRIQRALARVAAAGEVPIDRADVTLMGYSQGAMRAESLARFYGSHYPRIVLGGPPDKPGADHFPNARAVAVVGGEKEDNLEMQQGAYELQAGGKPCRFFLLPGVDHGEFGAAGNRVLAEALSFVLAPTEISNKIDQLTKY